MKIGILRHYEVASGLPGRFTWMTPEQFSAWLVEYELSEVHIPDNRPDLRDFSLCYASDAPRALATAHHAFPGKVTPTDKLRELVVLPPTKRNIRLPLMFWLILGRLAWAFSHASQIETKPMLHSRIHSFFDEEVTPQNGNILIVSHGAFLIFFRRELMRRGFKGPEFKVPANGQLYVFENE